MEPVSSYLFRRLSLSLYLMINKSNAPTICSSLRRSFVLLNHTHTPSASIIIILQATEIGHKTHSYSVSAAALSLSQSRDHCQCHTLSDRIHRTAIQSRRGEERVHHPHIFLYKRPSSLFQGSQGRLCRSSFYYYCNVSDCV